MSVMNRSDRPAEAKANQRVDMLINRQNQMIVPTTKSRQLQAAERKANDRAWRERIRDYAWHDERGEPTFFFPGVKERWQLDKDWLSMSKAEKAAHNEKVRQTWKHKTGNPALDGPYDRIQPTKPLIEIVHVATGQRHTYYPELAYYRFPKAEATDMIQIEACGHAWVAPKRHRHLDQGTLVVEIQREDVAGFLLDMEAQ